MKTLLLSLLLILLETGVHASGVNEELAELFNARHAAALAPAKEGRIDDIDPFSGHQTSGMSFKPSEVFALEKGSFETALKSAKIEDWTFGTRAPWSPGKQTHWVVLDPFGAPFLSLQLIEDQPTLVKINQVAGFAEGVATLGRTQHRYFRCELTSGDLVSFLQETTKKQARIPFVPVSIDPKNHTAIDPFNAGESSDSGPETTE